MTDLDPHHYVWTTNEDGQYWAYCYCAWTSPRTRVRADAIKLGEHHMRDAKFRFIEEGFPYHFEVPSEFIGRGVDPSRVDTYSDPDVGDTWTVTARDDDGTAVTISQDADSTTDLWHARDGATDIEFLVGDLETVVSAAAGVIRRAEALQEVKQ
ncbi:MAG: hypothetical protein M3460_25235 [Actinomycetota bacterium]|nr:hypothetical protein [Actinomycetota bacterium]